jgi:hypothetical protein
MKTTVGGCAADGCAERGLASERRTAVVIMNVATRNRDCNPADFPGVKDIRIKSNPLERFPVY